MAQSATHAHEAGHEHPGTGTYVQIAVVLFILTALEVGAYEIAERGAGVVRDFVTEILIVLSAVKFALVAFFYMHLKGDGKLLRRVFGFSLVIAFIVIGALMVLFGYQLKTNLHAAAIF
ncbi:MAG: cytochrome C oxidase subunit IV family protein [Gemmatimonadales bacterium]|nr:cytochrome C oxidase subunit IV family protein [Gemmatimonadales bacterium]